MMAYGDWHEVLERLNTRAGDRERDMPYKHPEDRAEAVRRHRVKKREQKEQRDTLNWILGELREFLTDELGYKPIPFWEFVAICQEDLKVTEEGVLNVETGKMTQDDIVVLLSDRIYVL